MSIGSGVLFLVLLIPIVFPGSDAEARFDWLLSIALLFPLVMGAWGILMAKNGSPGIIRIVLLAGHAGVLLFYVITFFMKLFG